MITSAEQLKAKIRNMAKAKSADAQVLMRRFMMERFLERASLSEYRDRFILKGGVLVASIAGVEVRSTLDLDATVRGVNIAEDDVRDMVAAILAVPVEDRVSFKVDRISTIMEEAEYPGVRVKMESVFDGVRVPIKLDISTGDTIIPGAVMFPVRLMFEERSIAIWAYNVETVLAEKLETILSRKLSNTRMRDFYDIYLLTQLQGDSLSPGVLNEALEATATKRGTIQQIKDAPIVFDKIEGSQIMKDLWRAYQGRFDYARSISWSAVMDSVRALYAKCARP